MDLPPSDFLLIKPLITPIIVKGIATSILTLMHTSILTLINTAITTVTTMTTPTQLRIATRQLTLIQLPILTPMEIVIRTMPIPIAAAKTLTPKTLTLPMATATNTTTIITTHIPTHTRRPQRLSLSQWPMICLKSITPPPTLTTLLQTTTTGINTAPTTPSRNALAVRYSGVNSSAGSLISSSGSPTYSPPWPEELTECHGQTIFHKF